MLPGLNLLSTFIHDSIPIKVILFYSPNKGYIFKCNDSTWLSILMHVNCNSFIMMLTLAYEATTGLPQFFSTTCCSLY